MKSIKHILRLIVFLILGIMAGVVAKSLDTVAVDGSWWNDVLSYAAHMMTRLGIWVFFAILIAAFSKTPLRAATHTFLFFAGMLIGYYIYSAQIFGFFPTSYFLYWGAAALATPVLAVITWFGKHHSRMAYFLPALPLGLLLHLALAIGFFYIDLSYVDEMIMYLVALAIFYKNPKQLAVTAGLSFIIAVLFYVFFPFHF